MKYSFAFITICALSGCEIPDKGVIETTPPPYIIQVSISPILIDVNHLASRPTDPVDTSFIFSVTIGDQDANTSVTYTILNPAGNIFLGGALLDNGVLPDQVAGDGKFSAKAQFHILKQDVGTYSVQFQATNASDFKSNIVVQPLLVKNSSNHRPSISNLTMPDSVRIPRAGDTTFIRITIAVSDTDGLGDIISVTLESQRPNGTNAGKFSLYDDGGTVPISQFGKPLLSGDAVANDGIYTVTIPFTKAPDPPETLPTYRDFSFKATDRAGEYSNVITKRIYIIQ